jgi:hypothetical protein
MKKPEYIQNIESKSEVFSIMVGPLLKGEFLKYLNDKKLSKVYESSTIDSDSKITVNKVIFKSQQGFYLCVENQTFIPAEPKFNLTIYYKAEQYNELYLFTSQLLKQYKNATTNNRTA